MMTDQAALPAIAIKRIKERFFSIRDDLFIDSNKLVKIEIGHELGFAIEANLVSLTIRIYYHFEEAFDPILADISVQNVFEISDLQSYIPEGGELKLPPVVISNIVGLSISHARALLAKELSGTFLEERLPTIVNPEEVARHFFPRMFIAGPVSD